MDYTKINKFFKIIKIYFDEKVELINIKNNREPTSLKNDTKKIKPSQKFNSN